MSCYSPRKIHWKMCQLCVLQKTLGKIPRLIFQSNQAVVKASVSFIDGHIIMLNIWQNKSKYTEVTEIFIFYLKITNIFHFKLFLKKCSDSNNLLLVIYICIIKIPMAALSLNEIHLQMKCFIFFGSIGYKI